MSVKTLSSAQGLISLLSEDSNALKEEALKRMSNESLVNEYWAEISPHIRTIEKLYEDEKFKNRELAAFVCSKIYYHLGAIEDSLQFALYSGNHFEINSNSEYVQTLIANCIDKYIALRQNNDKVEPRLQQVVDRMFARCFQDGEFKQALGLGIESKRLDIVEQSIRKSGQVSELASYCFTIAQKAISNREFRHEVLKTLISIYQSNESPDNFAVAQCFLFLNDPESVSKLIIDLIQGKEEEQLVAVQIAFDVSDRATQWFVTSVLKNLVAYQKEANKDHLFVVEKVISVLKSEVTSSLHVDFLYRHNHTDLNNLKNIKESFERNSIYHSATITANSYMHAGTTQDDFLRKNLEWLGQATNWAKFGATASLGVIHKGQIKESFNILKSYLPDTSSTTRRQGTSIYSEGGSLFALGLIHYQNGEGATEYLSKIVQNQTTDEVVQHGACLGIGLSSMGSGDEVIFENLKNILYLDSAVSGESAAMAMGLVMLGKGDNTEVTETMLSYAHDTTHEKIIRGLAMGLALTQYGREESADVLIDVLAGDKDPILRYGAMHMIGLAYCGTANSGAIRKLLHFAVSDVSDDVRRAAVTNLGFLLFLVPQQCPQLVNLLAESYNPHVRYGAALAIGISCAGTGMKDAIDLLEHLAKDRVDFVRQGAMIALAMVLVQYSEAYDPKVVEVRKMFEKSWTGRHEVMSKFGAILASGIIDAGGRNVTIGLQKNGHNKMRGIVGMTLFTQYWFWYPYLHFLSLTFEPTCMIGLNLQLKMPQFQFKSNAKPSLFAYPPDVKAPEKKAPTLAPTAQLSTSQKEKQKEKRKKKKDDSIMDEEPQTPVETPTVEKTVEFKEVKEPEFEILNNPARVTIPQMKYLSFDIDLKYVPQKKEMGIFMLKNLKPEESEALVELKNKGDGEEKEPNPPAPFYFP